MGGGVAFAYYCVWWGESFLALVGADGGVCDADTFGVAVQG